MNNELRGAQLPNSRFRTGPMPAELLHVEGYRNLQTFFPTLTKLFRIARWTEGNEIWMDTRMRIQGIDCSGTAGSCKITLVPNTDVSNSAVPTDVSRSVAPTDVSRSVAPTDVSNSAVPTEQAAFLKVTHLLDPNKWMRGHYSLPKESGLPWHSKSWMKAFQKLQDPWNQAYVETIASYALGRIKEEGLSPHFNSFYGGFCARANKYRYNMTDDFHTYRHESWFWKGYDRATFKFRIYKNATTKEELTEDEVREFIQKYKEIDDYGDQTSSEEEEELGIIDIGEEVELGSIKSADMSIASSVSSDSSAASTEISYDESDDYELYAEIDNYPVMLIVSEKNMGTMDMLFNPANRELIAADADNWERCWAAWIFQIVAGLSCAQTLIGFTHNDLHTNNVVWSETEDEFLYYTSRSGQVFRVPTFGKLFRIIDFGRSILTINGQMFISDDFKPGNDADGQYCFSPLNQRVVTEIPPNPSFDLCRLAVSLVDGIFGTIPEKKEGGGVLSSEKDFIVYETTSPLYNMIWSWMIDDFGDNIFVNPDGTERFPDFELYNHIAAHIHKAVPSQQVWNQVFDEFQVDSAPTDVKVYSLFC
jgi:hypothetical protein